ncbi:amidase [Neoroseomonas lacus]|uniref:Amidase n=1 Tax=Neoroseomonas lacus TaxID=287609 RepID=A0A917NXG1_9PROT|nr:amidase [Neoroseomonas lacus]GGJ38667.1 amidase [Neoroseomonas lacus]
MTALRLLTIAEAARRIAARDLSPVELTRAFLDRIATTDGVLHSFIAVTADAALAEAKQAEAAIMAGGARGPLHGVPYALKDIYDTAGLATTAHSARCKDRVPDTDAHAVAMLRAAGGVLLGKLATHEFATGGPSWDLPWPAARNPWDIARFPGGSSSGSGAAVAAALVPGAMGSDTGGSIRLPAAFCGTAGIKPTYGRVSKRGVLPLSFTLDNAGPLAWTVEDCAILLQAIAGHDPLDPASADVPLPDFRATLANGVKGLRIGVVRHWYDGDRRASPEVIAAMDAAIEVLRALGAEIREVTLRPLADYQACMRIIGLSESFAIHADHLRDTPQDYGEVFRYRIMPGAFVPATDYVQALRLQRVLAQQMFDALRDVDALVTASIWGEAPLMAPMRAEANFAAPPLTNPFNVSQLPALSLCNGFSAAGLPLSMQIAGRAFDEATVLRIGHAYEQATPWRARRPEVPATPFIDSAADQTAPPPSDAARETYAVLAARAALPLDARQFAQACEALPHVEAMGAALPRNLPFGAELATTNLFDAE